MVREHATWLYCPYHVTLCYTYYPSRCILAIVHPLCHLFIDAACIMNLALFFQPFPQTLLSLWWGQNMSWDNNISWNLFRVFLKEGIFGKSLSWIARIRTGCRPGTLKKVVSASTVQCLLSQHCVAFHSILFHHKIFYPVMDDSPYGLAMKCIALSCPVYTTLVFVREQVSTRALLRDL